MLEHTFGKICNFWENLQNQNLNHSDSGQKKKKNVAIQSSSDLYSRFS